MDVQARLARLEQGPDYARAMSHVPPSSTVAMGAVGIALAGAGAVVAILATTWFERIAGGGGALGGFACIAVAAFFAVTPLERVLAVVGVGADERLRTEPRTRRHYTTLERRDGVTREYRSSRELAARLEEGDVGVAYLKAGFLLDFRPLR